MSNLSKPASVRTYHVVLFDRALHPELFALKGRQTRPGRDFEVETWLTNGSHVVRFERQGACLVELVTDRETSIPRHGVISAFACESEHEFEKSIERAKCDYILSVQTETLSDALYASAFEEYAEFARENGAISNRWADDAGPCLSLVDTQIHHRQVHVQGYHLVATGGFFLRTQSIFELA